MDRRLKKNAITFKPIYQEDNVHLFYYKNRKKKTKIEVINFFAYDMAKAKLTSFETLIRIIRFISKRIMELESKKSY